MQMLKKLLCLLLITMCCMSGTDLIAGEKSKVGELTQNKDGYRNVTNQQLKELIEEDVLIVDIRREEEWKRTGVISGSETITFFDAQGKVNPNFVPEFTALVKKDQPVILICHSGVRTKVASQAIAKQLGYKKVINVSNGIIGWILEKRPVSVYAK